MSKYNPLEALLRTPVEWWSSGACIATGLLFGLANNILLLMPPTTYWVAGSLGLLGIKRFFDGYHVIQYQKNLKKTILLCYFI